MLALILIQIVGGCYSSSSTSEHLIGRPDAAVEITPDPGPTDCAPSTSRGECSVINQCECPAGQWCVWKVAPDIMSSCEAFEQCTDIWHQDLEPGQPCNSISSLHPCRPGSTCLDADFHRPTSSGICWEFCRTDRDCSVPGSRCSVPAVISVNGCPAGPIALPSNLCSHE
jgi:hypothetical protein